MTGIESFVAGGNSFIFLNDADTPTLNGVGGSGDTTGSDSSIVLDSAEPLTLSGVVGSGVTVQINTGTLLMDQTLSFAGSIDWNNYADTSPAEIILAGTNADSFSFSGSEMSFFQAGQDVLDVHFYEDQSGLTAPWSVSQTPQGIVISSLDPNQIPYAMPLTQLP